MDNTLVMYPNLQFNPVEIPDYTIVEIYKDSIATENGLGYAIIPIEGLTQEQIVSAAGAKAELKQPEGYVQYDILYGAEKPGFNHKIIYAVWYNAEKPVYPPEPSIVEQTPAQPLNIWKELEVDNAAAPSYVTVTLTCSAFDDTLEFYINNDYFAIDIKEPKSGVNTITIGRDGVTYNDKAIDSFKMSSAPKLKAGVNYIKVKTIGISNLGIKYRQKF